MNIEEIYPKCMSFLERDLWMDLTGSPELKDNPAVFPDILKNNIRNSRFPDFLPDLAQIESALHLMRSTPDVNQQEVTGLAINPTLNILELKWKNLANRFSSHLEGLKEPEPGDEMLLIWKHPETGKDFMEPAEAEDLLVLKMVVEDIPAETIAISGNVPVGAVDVAVNRAVQKGLLLMPEPLIRRAPGFISGDQEIENQPLQAHVFTLQWHVTQACDLRCKHCYDRSDRSDLRLNDGIMILDNLRNFCKSRHVHGQVTFSGGNPLLYPHFKELYREAFEKGFTVAILGNPAPKAQIEEFTAIAQPSFYQVSLEGLRKHNDFIRGKGHFERVIAFLKILKELNIYSMVMLTLTRDNIHQVLPLAGELRDLTDHFTFNRLSMVGEGASLKLPSRDEYSTFLVDYMAAALENPVMGLKDNLFNIIRFEKGMKTTGGCTGFGCGAAFNFLTLLPDGEVHACRKFPSLLGNALVDSLANIYESDLARKYRLGSGACSSCSIKPSCGGCLASAYSNNLDIFKDRDPYCFICQL